MTSVRINLHPNFYVKFHFMTLSVIDWYTLEPLSALGFIFY